VGLLKGILIYTYARRRTNKKRDRQEMRERAALEQELQELDLQELDLQGGSWAEEICDHCGRTNAEHLEDEEPCS